MASLLDDIATDIAQTFLDTSLGFAVVATTSGAANITGIFSRDYFAENSAGEVGIMSRTPVFRASSSDVTGLAVGNTLTIEGDTYSIVEPQPDQRGITDLRLQIV